MNIHKLSQDRCKHAEISENCIEIRKTFVTQNISCPTFQTLYCGSSQYQDIGDFQANTLASAYSGNNFIAWVQSVQSTKRLRKKLETSTLTNVDH